MRYVSSKDCSWRPQTSLHQSFSCSDVDHKCWQFWFKVAKKIDWTKTKNHGFHPQPNPVSCEAALSCWSLFWTQVCLGALRRGKHSNEEVVYLLAKEENTSLFPPLISSCWLRHLTNSDWLQTSSYLWCCKTSGADEGCVFWDNGHLIIHRHTLFLLTESVKAHLTSYIYLPNSAVLVQHLIYIGKLKAAL